MAQVRRQPQRTCLGCRQVKDQGQLIRFVRSPDGQILADLRSKLPGRGAYLCWSRDCIEVAAQKKQFDRTFKSHCLPITAEQMTADISNELLVHLGGLLGMARKSAQSVAGTNAVLATLGKSPLKIIVISTDISAKIGAKIKSKADRVGVETVSLFEKNELGRILGRAVRSVVGLPVGQLAEAFIADLTRYRDISGEN